LNERGAPMSEDADYEQHLEEFITDYIRTCKAGTPADLQQIVDDYLKLALLLVPPY